MTSYEAYHPFHPGHQTHLYEHLASSRQQCPVAHVHIPNSPAPFFLITRYEDVRELLENKDGAISNAGNFEIEGATNRAVSQIDGEPHEQLRTALRQAFNIRRYREIVPYIEEKTNLLIDALEARAASSGENRADLVWDLTAPLPAFVLFHLIGIPEEHVELCRSWIHEIIKITPAPIWDLPAWKSFSTFIDELIQEKRAHPQDDLLTKLIHDPAIAEGATQLHIFQLLIAGSDTTTQFLGSLLYRLLDQPERWEALLQNPQLVPQVIEEGLRYDPPVIWLMRTAEKSVTLRGIEIPAGSRLIVALAAANRDESIWNNSEAFEPERTENARHLSFGLGAHFCLGADLARKQTTILLNILLQRLPSLKLTEGFTYLDIPAPMFRGPITLPVTW